jgi:hypothetical protein
MHAETKLDQADCHGSSGREVLDIEAQAVACAAGSHRRRRSCAGVPAMCLDCAGRVVVTGMGKSGHIGGQDRRYAREHRHTFRSSFTQARPATATWG